MKPIVDLGVLYSRSGTYAAMSEALWLGTMDAVEAVNADTRSPIAFRTMERDPGSSAQVFGNPQHSYTRRLIEAVPHPDPTRAPRASVTAAGEPPSPVRRIGDAPDRVVLRSLGAGHLVAAE